MEIKILSPKEYLPVGTKVWYVDEAGIAKHVISMRYIAPLVLPERARKLADACDGYVPRTANGKASTKLKQLAIAAGYPSQGVKGGYKTSSYYIKEYYNDVEMAKEQAFGEHRGAARDYLSQFGEIKTGWIDYKDGEMIICDEFVPSFL